MEYVQQLDPAGCGIAVLAMLTDSTYQEVLQEIQADPWNSKGGAFKEGHSTNTAILEHYLTMRGWFHAARYESWCSEWPPEPFAPLHWVQITQPSGSGHFLAMDQDGTVLDPLRPGTFTLKDYPRIGHVMGWINPTNPTQ